jgi:hypothetical protein
MNRGQQRAAGKPTGEGNENGNRGRNHEHNGKNHQKPGGEKSESK